ncbi:MAG: PrsW family intramembrane metalloprotease [Spirochaetales bacterium]|nr:PrsW family intramembrane metalloprotease [Spirochaetales bacterium]
MVALSFVLSLLIGAAWFWVVTRLDPHRRDKGSQAVLLTFFLVGFLSLIPTRVLYFLSYAVWGNYLVGGWVFAFIDELFITGPVEEFAKFLTFLFLSSRLKSIKEPIDGVLQGAAVALAFATAENVIYGAAFGVQVLPIRAVLSTTGHLVYASMWGYIYGAVVYQSRGRKLREEYKAILAAVLPAALFHGLYNFLLDLGLFPLAVLVDICALVVAVAIYRYLRRLSPYRPLSRCKPREALAELTEALHWNPDSPLLNQRLALLHLYYRDFPKALAHVRICRKRLPSSPYFQCVEAAVRVLSGEVDAGAALMEKAYPRLSGKARKALKTNLRRVVAHGTPRLELPRGFLPGQTVSRRFFTETLGLWEPAPAAAYQRLRLTRHRYLARAG